MTEILESEFNIKSSVILEKLLKIWNNDVILFDVGMFDYFEKLKTNDDLNIALLSNVGAEHANRIDSYINMRYTRNYAIRYYSCNVGVRKPQSLYYQSFLQKYPEFNGCVYLDDLSENLLVSKEFGFKAVQFDLNKINSDEQKSMLTQIGNMILEPKE